MMDEQVLRGEVVVLDPPVYSSAYSAVFKHCTTPPTLEHPAVAMRHLGGAVCRYRGNEVYMEVEHRLFRMMDGWVEAFGGDVEPPGLASFTRKFAGCTKYLDRHYVQREQEEGNQDVVPMAAELVRRCWEISVAPDLALQCEGERVLVPGACVRLCRTLADMASDTEDDSAAVEVPLPAGVVRRMMALLHAVRYREPEGGSDEAAFRYLSRPERAAAFAALSPDECEALYGAADFLVRTAANAAPAPAVHRRRRRATRCSRASRRPSRTPHGLMTQEHRCARNLGWSNRIGKAAYRLGKAFPLRTRRGLSMLSMLNCRDDLCNTWCRRAILRGTFEVVEPSAMPALFTYRCDSDDPFR